MRLDRNKPLPRPQGDSFSGRQELITNQDLMKLVAEACSEPVGSKNRQMKLGELYRFVVKSNQLWKEDTSYYHDALQQTWLYLCQNLERYDPVRAGIITWLNNYLKWQLEHFRQQQVEEEAKFVFSSDKNASRLFEDLSAPPSASPILNEICNWAKSDTDRVLRNTLFRERSDLNAQILILRRLSSNTTWKTIAAEFKLTSAEAKDLPKFYNRKCHPLVRKFGKLQGYL